MQMNTILLHVELRSLKLEENVATNAKSCAKSVKARLVESWEHRPLGMQIVKFGISLIALEVNLIKYRCTYPVSLLY